MPYSFCCSTVSNNVSMLSYEELRSIMLLHCEFLLDVQRNSGGCQAEARPQRDCSGKPLNISPHTSPHTSPSGNPLPASPRGRSLNVSGSRRGGIAFPPATAHKKCICRRRRFLASQQRIRGAYVAGVTLGKATGRRAKLGNGVTSYISAEWLATVGVEQRFPPQQRIGGSDHR